ncbi:hypothetical protein BDQ12DRAFT_693007 [Crucibulum laeve]|uniref:Uncharacterized protein n=1 Tax=Crucibulum laeve TaxID=68775 RepID=A0A5C3LG42_9AGAR|nr:hypothetical protein BDQ12DRAFT_693007 [Crucibulum laeve]
MKGNPRVLPYPLVVVSGWTWREGLLSFVVVIFPVVTYGICGACWWAGCLHEDCEIGATVS